MLSAARLLYGPKLASQVENEVNFVESVRTMFGELKVQLRNES